MSLYGKIIRTIVMPSISAFTQEKYWKYYNESMKTQWLKEEEIKELQWKKLKLLLKNSYENVEIYHRKFREVNLKPEDIKKEDDLLKLPLTTKEELRMSFPDKTVSKIFPKESWVYGSTSGSTGEPLKFVINREMAILKHAYLMRTWNWAGYEFGEWFIDIRGRFDVKTSWKWRFFERRINRIILLNAFEMRDENMPNYIKMIKNHKDCFLRGYPSSVLAIARYMQKHKIELPVKMLLTQGETLTKEHREIIESVFKTKIFNGYGSGDCKILACECDRHEGLHISAESSFVEVLKDNEHVSSGETGEIIVTDLDNFMMPFIRYKVEDLGAYTDEKCSCGRGLPLLKEIIGRVLDFISTPSGKVLVVHFFTGFFMRNSEYVRHFQIIQKKKDELHVLIVPTENFNEDFRKTVYEKVQNYAGNDMKIIIDLVDEIPLTKGGKRRIIVSEIGK